MDSLAKTENSKDEKIQVGPKILQKAKILTDRKLKKLFVSRTWCCDFFFNLDNWIKKEANKI